MSRRDRRKEEIRRLAERLDRLLDELETAFEEYRRLLDAARTGDVPLEEEEGGSGALTPA
jgi:TATA-binding protein-associated factor Taf7